MTLLLNKSSLNFAALLLLVTLSAVSAEVTDEIEVLTVRAELLTVQGRSDEAVELYTQVIKLANEAGLTAGNLDLLAFYLQRRGYHKWKARMYDARADVSAALELDPSSAAGYFLRGQISLDFDSRFDLALQDLTKAEEMNPGEVNTLAWLGLAQFYNSDFDTARETAQRALSLDETQAQANLTIALLAYLKNDGPGVYRAAKKILEFQADDPKGQSLVGWAAYRAGQHREARVFSQKAYDRLHKQNPYGDRFFAIAGNTLAYVEYGKGDYSACVEMASRVLTFVRTSTEAYQIRAMARRKLGQVEQARSDEEMLKKIKAQP